MFQSRIRQLFLFIALIVPNLAFADLVASDFQYSESDTRYVCQFSGDQDGVQLFKRSAQADELWTLTNLYTELVSNIAARKRWKRRYLSRVDSLGKSDSKTKRARRKWRKLRLIVRELRSCGPDYLQDADACSALADGQRSSVNTRIINGLQCRRGASSVVELVISKRFSSSTCSGTVLSPYTVLTAAHCLEDNPRSVEIFTGRGSRTGTSFILHPDYDPFAFFDLEAYDVALVFTETPIPTRTSGILNGPVVPGEQALIAGFGLNEEGTYGDLRAAQMVITGLDSNTIETRYDGQVNASNTCFGDSGGPIMVFRDGEWVVAGTTSNGVLNSCGVGDITRYSNISNINVLAFIADNII